MDSQKRLDLLEEVRRDILDTEQNLTELRRLEAYLSAKAGVNGLGPRPDTPAPPLAVPAPTTDPPTARTPGTADDSRPAGFTNLHGKSQADAIAAVLKDIGHPMKTMEILDEMIERGFPAPAPNRRQSMANSLFSVMRRKTHRFRKTGKGLWGLAEWPQQ